MCQCQIKFARRDDGASLSVMALCLPIYCYLSAKHESDAGKEFFLQKPYQILIGAENVFCSNYSTKNFEN